MHSSTLRLKGLYIEDYDIITSDNRPKSQSIEEKKQIFRVRWTHYLHDAKTKSQKALCMRMLEVIETQTK